MAILENDNYNLLDGMMYDESTLYSIQCYAKSTLFI